MDVTIIGTGNMARGIGTRAIAGGHDVTVIGKDEGSAQEVVADLESASGEGANESFDGFVVPPDGSATDELAKLAPDAKFVKAFNTTFAGTLIEGQVAGQPLDVYIAGDDDEAKQTVAQLVRDGALTPIDVGGLARARELEGLGLLHMGVQGALGTNYGSTVKLLS